jgi:3-isopropylmalate dehydrogenase
LTVVGRPVTELSCTEYGIFRENTEGLYSEIEYSPLSPDLGAILSRYNHMDKFAGAPADKLAVALRVIARKVAGSTFDKEGIVTQRYKGLVGV